MPLDQRVSTALYDLVGELSSELDLHHSDSELPSLQSTLQVVAQTVGLMKRHGCDIPDSYLHIMKRYEHSGGQESNPVYEHRL